MKDKIQNTVFPTKYSESVKFGTLEYNNSPTMTEPDNAMSIPEIIARFTRGQGLMVQQHQWTTGSAPEGDRPYEDDFSFIPGMAPKEPEAPKVPQTPQEPQTPTDPEAPKE